MNAVERQLLAYNARDLEGFLSCYHVDVIVSSAAGRRLMAGHVAMRAVYGQLFQRSADLKAEVLARIQVGAFVIDEERVSGMAVPGSPSSMQVGVVYQLEHDLIVRVIMLI